MLLLGGKKIHLGVNDDYIHLPLSESAFPQVKAERNPPINQACAYTPSKSVSPK